MRFVDGIKIGPVKRLVKPRRWGSGEKMVPALDKKPPEAKIPSTVEEACDDFT